MPIELVTENSQLLTKNSLNQIGYVALREKLTDLDAIWRGHPLYKINFDGSFIAIV